MSRVAWLVAAAALACAPGSADPAAERGARLHVVEMRNFAFSPARLEVAVGDTIVWVNRDAAPHTATDSAARWDSGEMGPGGRWSHVVREPGRVAYYCAYHPTMRGEWLVRAAAVQSTPTEEGL